jgi:hypothetical protein
MANKIVIAPGGKLMQVEQTYYSPAAVIPPNLTVPIGSTYCFLSKVEPWPNDTDPPTPSVDVKNQKQVFKNMFVVKQIRTGDISPVIQRVDWESSIVYAYYRDDLDMTEKDQNGNLIRHFYVKNKYDQVFKCLWNNNGGLSLNEPFFEPGAYNTNNIYQGNDNYKWKYMYTIDSGSKVKFMDSKWIPIILKDAPNPLVSTAKAGNIDVINVHEGGSGYDPSNSLITITITGDGSGANAVANVLNGSINDIVVVSPGTNYSYANVTITTSSGNGAVAYANTSPVGGHGFDPASELGCDHIMYSVEFTGNEGGVIPTDIDFHQIGILINPTTAYNSPNPANGIIYRTTTDLLVAPGFGVYTNDEIVYQGTSLTDATFVGRVLSFDVASNILKLINITGNHTLNGSLFGNDSGTTRTLLAVSPPTFTVFSGYIAYIENRTGVQRSADGIEQFRLVLGY